MNAYKIFMGMNLVLICLGGFYDFDTNDLYLAMHLFSVVSAMIRLLIMLCHVPEITALFAKASCMPKFLVFSRLRSIITFFAM